MDHLVYLDHAATTAARPEVVEAMLPYFTEKYGNPSSIYSLGSETKAAIAHAREVMATSIGTTSENIYFTAGGSESDNWALVATAEAYASKGKHIITSKIEHHAILHTCDYLASRGYEITYIDVDENGVIKLDNASGKLAKGADKLAEGTKKFNDKGIKKLSDTYNDDIKTANDRFKEVVNVGKEYKSFSGINNKMDGEVKFIIETEAVKNE